MMAAPRPIKATTPKYRSLIMSVTYSHPSLLAAPPALGVVAGHRRVDRARIKPGRDRCRDETAVGRVTDIGLGDMLEAAGRPSLTETFSPIELR
jgi:hypothetical protein